MSDSTNLPAFGHLPTLREFTFGKFSLYGVIIDGEPWVEIRSVCRSLELAHHHNVMAAIRAREASSTRNVRMLCQAELVGITGGRELHDLISEAAFYLVVMRSDAPHAVDYQDWVIHDVLPELRKTGAFLPTREQVSPADLLVEKARTLLAIAEHQRDTDRKLVDHDQRLGYLEDGLMTIVQWRSLHGNPDDSKDGVAGREAIKEAQRRGLSRSTPAPVDIEVAPGVVVEDVERHSPVVLRVVMPRGVYAPASSRRPPKSPPTGQLSLFQS